MTIGASTRPAQPASGPTGFKVEGNEIVFEPLPKLAPRADAIYRIQVKCTAAGIAHFKARMTSAILTESVYGLHGVGYLAYTAVGNFDVVTLLSIVMLTAFAVVILGAVVDLLYAFLDPRIRLA